VRRERKFLRHRSVLAARADTAPWCCVSCRPPFAVRIHPGTREQIAGGSFAVQLLASPPQDLHDEGVGDRFHNPGGCAGIQLPRNSMSWESLFRSWSARHSSIHKSPLFNTNGIFGQQTIEGVVAEGKRITQPLHAGHGQPAPITTSLSNGSSPGSPNDLSSTRIDPRMGETTSRLTTIQRTEPTRNTGPGTRDTCTS